MISLPSIIFSDKSPPLPTYTGIIDLFALLCSNIVSDKSAVMTARVDRSIGKGEEVVYILAGDWCTTVDRSNFPLLCAIKIVMPKHTVAKGECQSRRLDWSSKSTYQYIPSSTTSPCAPLSNSEKNDISSLYVAAFPQWFVRGYRLCNSVQLSLLC